MTIVTVQNPAGVDYQSYINAFTGINVFNVVFAPIVDGTTITLDLGLNRSVVFTGVFAGTQVVNGSGPVTQVQFLLNGLPDVTATGMTFTLQGLVNGALAGPDALRDVLFGEPYQFTGNAGGDIFISGYLDDLISGLGGNDSLNGGYGNDTLIGGTGTDTLIGGFGDDVFVNPLGDVIVELAGGGVDTVQSNVTFSLAALAHVENVTLTGTANINAVGNALANVLTGNAGNNTLSGGAGPDTMIGGAGNDIYYVENSGDVTIELAGGGIDLVSTTISHTLKANIENLNLNGTAHISGNGNKGANIINGNSGNNILRGYEGSDTLNGKEGQDILLGGTSTDYLNPGNDAVRDIIRFSGVGDSTGSQRDIVTGMDLDAEDKFDFTVVPTSLAFVSTGTLNLATINADLAAAVNAALAVNGAVLFDPSGGDLNVTGHSFLIVDANGDGIYKPNQDYVVQLINPTGTLTLDDFM